jgi:hypothetical protein
MPMRLTQPGRPREDSSAIRKSLKEPSRESLGRIPEVPGWRSSLFSPSWAESTL